MIKDVRKAFLTFWRTQFLQDMRFEIFSESASFKSLHASTAITRMFWERSGLENKCESPKIYSKVFLQFSV